MYGVTDFLNYTDDNVWNHCGIRSAREQAIHWSFPSMERGELVYFLHLVAWPWYFVLRGPFNKLSADPKFVKGTLAKLQVHLHHSLFFLFSVYSTNVIVHIRTKLNYFNWICSLRASYLVDTNCLPRTATSYMQS